MAVRNGRRVPHEPGGSFSLEAIVYGAWCADLCSPTFVRSDNGPEFIASEVQAWLKESGSAPHFIDPGCPWQNGFTESFHGKLRDEFLSREVFASVAEAQMRLEIQRGWYNEERPHSSLKYVPPATFARDWRQEQAEIKPPC